MRQVEILEQPRNQRPWVAVNSETKKPVIRMQRLETFAPHIRRSGLGSTDRDRRWSRRAD
jgi:hypothetical protein